MLEPLRSFQDEIHLLSLLLCVCVCARFKSLSPGQLSYLCHITSCPIRALQKGPVSAHLTMWRRDGRMEGATSHPHKHLFGSLWLAESERGRQVRLSMCVFNNGSNNDRQTDTSREKDTWKYRPSQQSQQSLKQPLRDDNNFLHPSVHFVVLYLNTSFSPCFTCEHSWGHNKRPLWSVFFYWETCFRAYWYKDSINQTQLMFFTYLWF